MSYPFTAPGAVYMGDLAPGSSEQRRYRSRSIAPSDIAAVMGRSPYQDRDDLLARKAQLDGTRPPPRDPQAVAAAWKLQPELAGQFAAEHPQYTVAETRYWKNRQRPYQRAWPHRIVLPAAPGREPVEITGTLTFRTTTGALAEGWGPDGSDRIPLADYDHHQWLLDVLSLDHGWIIACGPGGTDRRVYRIGRDNAHITILRTAALAFLQEVAQAAAPVPRTR